MNAAIAQYPAPGYYAPGYYVPGYYAPGYYAPDTRGETSVSAPWKIGGSGRIMKNKEHQMMQQIEDLLAQRLEQIMQ